MWHQSRICFTLASHVVLMNTDWARVSISAVITTRIPAINKRLISQLYAASLTACRYSIAISEHFPIKIQTIGKFIPWINVRAENEVFKGRNVESLQYAVHVGR